MTHHDALDALIATAKAHDHPPEGAEDQAWAAFVAPAGGGPGHDVPAAATKGPLLTAGLKVVLAVAAVSTVTAGAVLATQEPTPASTPEPPRTVAPAPRETPPPPTAPAQVQAPSPPTAPVPRETPPRIVRPAARAPQTGAQPPETPASTLAEEARQIGAMWKALERGHADQALELASAYRRRFPTGTLSVEARAAAVAARCVLGRPIDLREREQVEAAASGAVRRRIRSACQKNRDVPPAAAATPGHD